MLKTKYFEMKQLIASLEEISEDTTGEFDSLDDQELQDAQIALEGYQDLLMVNQKLTKQGIKIDESVATGLLSLASPKINKDPLLKNYSEESVADKAKDFGKWVLEKIKALIAYIQKMCKLIIEKIKNGFAKLFNKVDDIIPKIKKANETKITSFKVTFGNEDGEFNYITVNGKLLTPKQVEDGIDRLLVDLPEHFYNYVSSDNLLEKKYNIAYIKGINSIANGPVKFTNKENVELRNVPDTNFFIQCSEPNEKGDFHVSRLWGTSHIEEFLGNSYFPKEITLDISNDFYEDSVKTFEKVRNDCSKKFEKYVADINKESNRLLDTVTGKMKVNFDESNELIQTVKLANDIVAANLEIIRFAYSCSSAMLIDLVTLNNKCMGMMDSVKSEK